MDWSIPDTNTFPPRSTGVDQSISLPVVMPAGGYAYRVFLDIRIEGILILAFEADEAVIIPWVGPPVITW
ncbi:unnamed protein product [marine sediment metagenome]|uniref:Uncharacterized protein n=1 Tax=marine sediment metagenome TaxID=412755 RepID=X1UTY5_9ZZZZ